MEFNKKVVSRHELAFVASIDLSQQPLGSVPLHGPLDPSRDPKTEPVCGQVVWERPDGKKPRARPRADPSDRAELFGAAQPLAPHQFAKTVRRRRGELFRGCGPPGAHRFAAELVRGSQDLRAVFAIRRCSGASGLFVDGDSGSCAPRACPYARGIRGRASA